MSSYLQISLSVTVLLALTVFLLLVAERLPTQSDSVPLIGWYNVGYIVGCYSFEDLCEFSYFILHLILPIVYFSEALYEVKMLYCF